MKKFFSIALIFILQLSFGQDNQYVKIPGTVYSLIPPDGFELSSDFTGFESIENGASIMVNEIPAPYQQLADGFTPEALKAKGMILISKETIDWNNSKAYWLYISQTANGIMYLKQLLLFGNENKTTLANGIYPELSKNIESAIKKSILTIREGATLNSDPEKSVKFSIDVTGSEFKFTKNTAGTLLYSIDGMMHSKNPTLIVGNSLSKVFPENKQSYAEERLKKMPGAEKSIIKSINKITINELNGFELIAENKKADATELIYEVMLFDGNDYYLIVGRTKEKRDDFLVTFKRIAHTFKRK